MLFAALPIDKVERTPFQRDVSDAHVRKLTLAMDKTRRYLDPIIAVREEGRYLSPNGGHRLTALRELGAQIVLALLVPERQVAYQILALNIEKAHNLREKALEVVRMYRDLAAATDPTEIGAGARVRGARAGHARLRLRAARPALRRRVPPGAEAGSTAFLDRKLSKALAERERRAGGAARARRRGRGGGGAPEGARVRLPVPEGASWSRASTRSAS